MSTEEIFNQSGYPQPKDKFDKSKNQFDYWDMLNFADLVAEKKVKNNDLLHSVVVPKGTLCSEMCCDNEATHISYTDIWYSCDKHRT